MKNLGWVPPEARTIVGQRLTEEMHDLVGTFGDVGSSVVIPDKQIFAEYELQINGSLLPRIWQKTGSCVGCGGETSYGKTRLADIVFRDDTEPLKVGFPFATYGIGRRKGGMRRPGEGSFGMAQAWACDPDNFGYLPWDHPLVPKPEVKGEWWAWNRREEINWSHPSAWDAPEKQLTEDASKLGIRTVTQCTDIDQFDQGLAQGFPATIASMYGTRPKVEGDVLIGRWNDEWAHQMSIPPTLWNHPDHGWIYQCDNQWGPDAHPLCPTLSKLGVTGSFWILRKDMIKIIRTGEVYLHSNTGNFEGNGPVKDWTMGIQFSDDPVLQTAV